MRVACTGIMNLNYPFLTCSEVLDRNFTKDIIKWFRKRPASTIACYCTSYFIISITGKCGCEFTWVELRAAVLDVKFFELRYRNHFGGQYKSSSLDVMRKLVKTKFPLKWNYWFTVSRYLFLKWFLPNKAEIYKTKQLVDLREEKKTSRILYYNWFDITIPQE